MEKIDENEKIYQELSKQFDQKEGKRLVDKYLGPLSEIVDLEDPDNKNLHTCILYHKSVNSSDDSKSVLLIELNTDLLSKLKASNNRIEFSIRNQKHSIMREVYVVIQKYRREINTQRTLRKRVNFLARIFMQQTPDHSVCIENYWHDSCYYLHMNQLDTAYIEISDKFHLINRIIDRCDASKINQNILDCQVKNQEHNYWVNLGKHETRQLVIESAKHQLRFIEGANSAKLFHHAEKADKSTLEMFEFAKNNCKHALDKEKDFIHFLNLF